jgi:hypothetical protein
MYLLVLALKTPWLRSSWAEIYRSLITENLYNPSFTVRNGASQTRNSVTTSVFCVYRRQFKVLSSSVLPTVSRKLASDTGRDKINEICGVLSLK